MKRIVLPTLWAIMLLAMAFALPSCRDCSDKPSAKTTKAAPPQYGIRPGLVTDSAMVVTAHPEASEIGLAILKKGGNAVDAAVAVNFALAVCFNYAGNIGGGGFMVLRMADSTANTLDFRETAPAAASRDMYLDEQGNVIPKRSEIGIHSVGVPGSVEGMVEAHKKYGQLAWADLVQPSVELARNGYLATAHEAKWLNDTREDFLKYNPDSTGYLIKGKDEWKEGDTIRQLDLALTLERIRDKGRDGFYKGETAKLLLAHMEKSGGILTQADLDAYRAKWREPLQGEYKGMTILTMPPPSSGGIVLLQLLHMVADAPLSKWGPEAAESVHRIVEAERRAYADRAEWLGDPDFVQIPLAGLLDSAYLNMRMADFDPAKATPSDSIRHGNPLSEPNETTHFSIVDAQGNAVAVTTTLNAPYGSKVWVPGAGFLLNNEMDDFSAKPGVPNLYGLVGNEANAIAPGKRMLSSMTPTIVVKDGRVYMVLGTPGGSTIITSVLQVLLDVTEFGMTLQEAVDHLRYHHQWLPDEIVMEVGALPEATVTALQAKGHVVKTREPIGRVDAILRRPDGKLEGAADPRRDDAARGY